MTTVQAVYSNGALYPVSPLNLTEGETVLLAIAAADAQMNEDAVIEKIAQSKTIQDWFAATQLLPEGDGGYDMIASLRANRIWSGETAPERR